MRFRTRSLVASLGGLALVVFAPAPASAHVEPEVATVPAGSLASVEFNVEHGCDGSPTVKMEFQVPEGITGAQPVEKAGWTGTLVDGVITYIGGSLPADREDTFGVRFDAPSEVGTVVRFAMIQTCETGSIDWIQTDPDAERPAPSVEIAEPDPTLQCPALPLPPPPPPPRPPPPRPPRRVPRPRPRTPGDRRQLLPLPTPPTVTSRPGLPQGPRTTVDRARRALCRGSSSRS